MKPLVQVVQKVQAVQIDSGYLPRLERLERFEQLKHAQRGYFWWVLRYQRLERFELLERLELAGFPQSQFLCGEYSSFVLFVTLRLSSGHAFVVSRSLEQTWECENPERVGESRSGDYVTSKTGDGWCH
jgi:hypothetical protein